MLIRFAYVIIDSAKLIIQYIDTRRSMPTSEDNRNDDVDERVEKTHKDITSKQIELMSRQIELESNRLKHQSSFRDTERESVFSILKNHICFIIVCSLALVFVFDRFDVVSVLIKYSRIYLAEIRRL